MNGGDLHLRSFLPGQAGSRLVGRLTPRNLSVGGQPRAVQLVVEFMPQAQPTVDVGRERLILLDARSTDESRLPTWGRWEVGTDQLPRLDQIGQQQMYWRWLLTHADLAALEAKHSRMEAFRTISFTLLVSGLAQFGEAVQAVEGETQITIPRSEWEDLVLEPLGYGASPSWSSLLPNEDRLAHPAWQAASDRLKDARKLLRSGQARDALRSTLNAFESLVSSPYNPDSWRALFVQFPEQKQTALAEMLGGICDYLNKVGHHRDRIARDSQGQLQEMPIDQWEAEHVIGAAQLLLAMALRLNDSPPA